MPATDRILIFHQTAPNLRHASIEYGIAAVEEMGAAHNFTVEQTQDSSAFTDANLARFDAVVWLNTIGVVFDEQQRAAFRRYVTGGGGWAGVHGPAGQENNWPWYYNDLVGTYIKSLPRGPGLPETQEALVRIEDQEHASTAALAQEWKFAEEWWNFYEAPRQQVHVLATLDEATYNPGHGPMGADHPVAWCHRVGAGRAWYTNLGHSVESYSDPAFLSHLLGGIRYAMGRAPGTWAGPATEPDSAFARVGLAEGVTALGDPTAMAVLPDRRVLHAARDGVVRLTTTDGATTAAGRVPVDTRSGDGLLGIAVDPCFATNGWVYLYYAPEGDDAAELLPLRGHHQLSRVPLTGSGTLDLAGEQQILRVPADLGAVTNLGGHIGFDSAGNLLLSTGDNRSPSAGDGLDPQRTSADPDDLRGKLLRISVQPDGSYLVPSGNLFAPGTESARAEVYAMGLRNPVRFSVDLATDRILLGDHGPEAGSGQARFLLITEPGDYGRPAAPGGAAPAWIAYEGGSVAEFGARRGGASPMGGPVYRFDPGLSSATKFPADYDGRFFAYERERGWIKEIAIDRDGGPGEIRPLLNSLAATEPVDVGFGPDGSLYVLDAGGSTRVPSLHRIDHTGGRHAPTAVITADATSGPVPLEVEFSSAGSHRPDGGELQRAWDFDGTGAVPSAGPEPVRFRYTSPGSHTAVLTVTDPEGRAATASVTVVAGATRPVLAFADPVEGQLFRFGGTVPFSVSVVDAEGEAPLDRSAVTVEFALGRMVDGRPLVEGPVLARATGCEGELRIPAEAADPERIGILTAVLTRPGSGRVPALTGSVRRVLQPALRSAASFDESFGVRIVPHAAAASGRRLSGIDGWHWVKFDPVNLVGVTGISLRVSAGGSGGAVEVQSHVTGGPVVASFEVPDTGGQDRFVDLPVAPVTDPGGTEPLYLVFRSPSPGLFTLDTVRFHGPGLG